ncbi:MAG: hypothetical protein GXY48_00895, partial [Methanomicrobiales archaeon]|nr:hypothetical protein [Methanomicrobiales archaeon]
FDVIDSKTKKPITDRKLVEKLYQRLGSELNIQHLWHAMWRYKDSPHADYYQNIDESIIKKHKSEEELIKFPPKGSVEGVFIDTVINTLYPPDGEYIPYSPGASIQYGVLNDEYHGKFVKTDVGIFEPPELSGSTVQLDSENSLPNTLTTGEFAFFQKIPALRDQKYASEALCRGACGMDCNKERCDDQEDIIIPIEGGNCVYTGVVECKSHQGCRDHDTCYDWCAELGEKRVTGFSSIPSAAQFFTPTGFLSNLIFGEQVIPGFCHRICDMRCVDYVSETQGFWSSPLSICINWAGLTGWEDTITTVPYDGTILFSNPPEFKEITPTPTSTPTPTTVSSKVEESCSKGYEFYSTASLSGWEGTEISGDYVSINKKIEGPTVSSICGWDPEIRSYLTAKIDYHERDSTKIKEEFHKEVESKKKSGYDVSIRPITMNNFSGECYETGPRFVGGGMTGDGMYRDARWVNTARGYLVDENGTLIEITYQVVGTGCSGNEHNDFLESKCPAQFNEVKSVSSSIQVKCKE